jgi:hypothetical protein
MLFALILLAASPTGADAQQSATTNYTPRSDSSSTDSAVPLDWAGPAARRPGADANVQQFNPEATLFEQTEMCVVVPGQPKPACALAPTDGLQISGDIFSASSNPDSTCQTIESVRMGADGKPNRVFATVCGDEAEAWSYRQRSTPGSRRNPTRTGARAVGPNDIVANQQSPQ